jgi:hypothetical protein
MLENLEIKNTTNEIEKRSTTNLCENTGKENAWTRNCPKCNKLIIYTNKNYYKKCIKNNSKCHNCPRPSKITTIDFIKKSKVIHNDTYNYSKFIYKNIKTKGIIICPVHGEFIQLADSHLQGSGCPRCSNNIKLTTEFFIEKSNQIHGSKYNYSNVVYINMEEKIKIICPIHGEFLQRPHSHLNGSGCRKCFNKKLKESMMSNIEEFVSKSKKLHGNKYDYSLITKYGGSNTNIKIYCIKCKNSFNQKPYSHLQGHGCPHCISIISKPEMKFLSYLKIPEKNRQIRINPFRFKVDGINGNKIFEFLGDYWHGNPRKFDHNDINKISKKMFGELYNDVINRFKILTNIGYKVYYIWELDYTNWLKNKQSIFPIKLFKI